MALAPAALPACGKCRRLVPKEKPPGCVLYRHKEDLPLDAAPFFDLYADGQEPDSFRNLWLRDELPYRAPLFQTEVGNPWDLRGPQAHTGAPASSSASSLVGRRRCRPLSGTVGAYCKTTASSSASGNDTHAAPARLRVRG